MFNDLYKENCSCGKSHKLEIENIIIEKDAEKHLPNLTKKYNNILLLSNAVSYSLFDDKIIALLDGKNVSTLIFEENIIILNEETVYKFHHGTTFTINKDII